MGIEKLFERFVKATEPDDRKLYITSVLYSLFHLALMWHAYLRLHHSPPYALVIVHMVFVGLLYALPKEIQRWHNGTKPPSTKAGHLLVLSWFGSFLLMALGQHFVDAKDYMLPEGFTEMMCFLLATLGLTHASARKHALKHAPCPEAPPSAPAETAKPPS